MPVDDGEWVPVSTAEMCQQSHGGPTCRTDAEFERRHAAYRAGLRRGLRQWRGGR